MKNILVFVALFGCVVIAAPPLAAQALPAPQFSLQPARLSPPAAAPIAAAVKQADPWLAAARALAPAPRFRTSSQPGPDRNWIRRHPAMFGALVGAGAGLVMAGTMENELFCSTGSDEDCLFYQNSRFAVGAGIGAGVGALIGWIVSLGR